MVCRVWCAVSVGGVVVKWSQVNARCGKRGAPLRTTVIHIIGMYAYRTFSNACTAEAPETILRPISINTACPLVVDVRTQFEWDAGHAECAHRLELHNDPTLEAKLLVLANGNRNFPVHVYCQSGARGGSARDVLLAKGWTNVINAGGWATLHNEKIKALCDCKAKGKVLLISRQT